MSKDFSKKNIKERKGIKFLRRWVILNVPVRIVRIIQEHAEDQGGISTAKSLEIIVDKSKVDKK